MIEVETLNAAVSVEKRWVNSDEHKVTFRTRSGVLVVTMDADTLIELREQIDSLKSRERIKREALAPAMANAV